MSPHPTDLLLIYAIERQDRNAPLFWCGKDRWKELDHQRPGSIRRYRSPEDAIADYERYFKAIGKRPPPADAIDVGIKPGVLCECGKLRFLSKRHAERVLIQLWLDPSVRRLERRVYECDVVPRTWHLTKQQFYGDDGGETDEST